MDFFDKIQFFGWVKLPPVTSPDSGLALATALERAGIRIRIKSFVNIGGYGTGVYDINEDYLTRDVYVKRDDHEEALVVHHRIEKSQKKL